MDTYAVTRPHMGANPWKVGGDQMIDRFRELHSRDLSFGEIAVELSAEFRVKVTRNSCISKARRVGLPIRALTPAERGKITHRRWKDRQEAVPRLRPAGVNVMRIVQTKKRSLPPEMRLADVQPLHLDLFDLKHGQCRYPYGDGPFTFCGCPAADGSSYCAAHHQLTHGATVLTAEEVIANKRAHRARMMARAA